MADSNFTVIEALPPLPGSTDKKDTAKYIQVPDRDFLRPYLGIIGGSAFVWPLGVEGFTVRKEATLGKHKYIGAIDIDVDVVHRSETTITMSGVFPGKTASKNMRLLNQIFDTETPKKGKVLWLPGVLVDAAYVVCESLESSHAADERLDDIQYQLEMTRIGTGTATTDIGGDGNGGGGDTPVTGTQKFIVTQGVSNLRQIAQVVYGGREKWVDLYAIPANAKIFTDLNVPTHKIPEYHLTVGTVILY